MLTLGPVQSSQAADNTITLGHEFDIAITSCNERLHFFLNGLISDLAIYDHSLIQQQVAQLTELVEAAPVHGREMKYVCEVFENSRRRPQRKIM